MDAVTITPERAHREGDQPLPTKGRENVFADLIRTLERHPTLFDPRAVEMVRPLLAEREALGVRRYGRSLESFNHRDAHLDLIQELLDAMVYAHQTAMERAALDAELARVRDDFDAHVSALDSKIARLIAERDRLGLALSRETSERHALELRLTGG